MQIRLNAIHRFLLPVLALLCWFGIDQSATAASCSADQDGKYYHRVYTLLVPDDAKKYGDCHDYGFWKGGSYANHTGIPPGYWVYVKPYWYVYAELSANRDKGKNEGCSPSQGGKYSGQLHKLYLPSDQKKYKNCHDYGWWNGKSYAGHKNLTAGYWVYAYPNWYIWQNKR